MVNSNGYYFTEREFDCLAGVASGKTTALLATELRVSERTINFHMNNIVQKLGAKNRTHAVALAVSSGILDLDNALGNI